MHLRHTFNKPQQGWHRAHELNAALAAWVAQIEDARGHGRMPPRAEDVAWDVYDAAIRGAQTKPRRKPAPPPEAPVASAQVDESTLLRLFGSLLEKMLRAAQVPEQPQAAGGT
jgi:hypothetical protein